MSTVTSSCMCMLQGEGFDGVVVEIWSQLGGHYKAYVRPCW